jgi:hypothetical protein
MSRHYGKPSYVHIDRDEHGHPKRMVWETGPLDAGPQARKTDPETSHEAAQAWTQEGLTALQWIVFETLRQHGPMIDQERVCIVQREHPNYGDSSIRTRRDELVTKGRVIHVGFSRTTSGQRSRKWRAV